MKREWFRLVVLFRLHFAFSALQEAFSKLKQFKDREGHCLLRTDHLEGEYELGAWVSQQRKYKTKGKLIIAREKKLNELGFIWDIKEHNWQEAFSKLKQFKDREGHCDVVQAHSEDEFLLGQWVSSQRQAQDSMSEHRKRSLNDIGFIWIAPKGPRYS